jgi:hypothetical protein
VIRSIILEDAWKLGRPLDRDHIASRLSTDPRALPDLRARYRGQKGSLEAWCGNLVDWYSADWTKAEDAGRLSRSPDFAGIIRHDIPGERHWLYEGVSSET